MLELLLDGVTIDRDNNVEITLAVPTEDFVLIEPSASGWIGRTPGERARLQRCSETPWTPLATLIERQFHPTATGRSVRG